MPYGGAYLRNFTLMEDLMSEQNNATVATPETATAAQPEQRTFTQTELDAIIRDRLSREREKYADYDTLKDKAQRFDAAEEAGKSELQKAQEKANALQAKLDALVKANSVNEIRAKVAQETGVPANLLSGDTEEACKAQAQGILAFAKPASYPQVRDAGEVNKNAGTGNTRDQFASWFNENLK